MGLKPHASSQRGSPERLGTDSVSPDGHTPPACGPRTSRRGSDGATRCGNSLSQTLPSGSAARRGQEKELGGQG